MIRTVVAVGACVALDLFQWAWYQRARRQLGIPEIIERLDEAHARADARLAIVEQRRAARLRFPRRAA
jgi:hypothetical protein